MAAALVSPLSLFLQSPKETQTWPLQRNPLRKNQFSLNHPSLKYLHLSKSSLFSERFRSVSGKHLSEIPSETRNYEFSDGVSEVELRLHIGSIGVESSSDIFVDTDDTSLLIRVKVYGSLVTLMETNRLYDTIKPSETIWYVDEDQLVVNLTKCDADLTWPDVMESWESLTSGVPQLLKGTSIYIVGDSTEVNQKVTSILASGIGYIPLYTSDLLERYTQQTIASWVISEGADSVVEAEGVVLESLSSHVRAVVATLGGKHGAARRHDKWRHLHAGFSVWLSLSQATDEASAKEEARMHIRDGSLAYSNADVVVKVAGSGWEVDTARDVAQAALSALKRLILSDKQLTGKKSLYIRLGCRGDWPNIKPPGWDPSTGTDPSSSTDSYT